MKYDYLIVGAGPFGATFSRLATDMGKRCLVIDRRDHLAGNMFTKRIENIDVHMYGPHIFHTNDRKVWDFVNQFGEWTQFKYAPKARSGNRIFSFPINLLTLHQLWGVTTPEEARRKLEQVRIPNENPQNAEQWILSQVGRELYELFFRGYTRKQWFRDPSDLPKSIVARIPIRLTFNDNYFSDEFQALPQNGYTEIIENMMTGIDHDLNVDFSSMKNKWSNYADQLIFTGPIDSYYDYEYGRLEYRANRFEMEIVEGDFQGHPVINYPDESVAFTRITEHKHFGQSGPKHIRDEKTNQKSVITRDIPLQPNSPEVFNDPHYPVRDTRNCLMLEKYQKLAKGNSNVLFGGRLGEYRYYDMDQVFASAIHFARKHVSGRNDLAKSA